MRVGPSERELCGRNLVIDILFCASISFYNISSIISVLLPLVSSIIPLLRRDYCVSRNSARILTFISQTIPLFFLRHLLFRYRVIIFDKLLPA